jgi:uncharacterized protein (DUF111 family)
LTIAYFDCFSGASGDMLLGCLVDVGLDLDELRSDLTHLGVGGYQLEAQPVTRHGLSGTHLRVHIETQDRPARTLPAIERLLHESDLPESVQARSLAVFTRLARAEALVHGTTIDRIHFHEIGAVDSLVDIVGFVCALDRLGIEAVYSSPLTLGGGTVQTEHGRLPAPAPATLALLAEVGAPTVPGPAMTVHAVGYGFGTKEFDWPNGLRVWLGEPLSTSHLPEHDTVTRLDCNLDDATGETLAYAQKLLLAAGALDAWFAPIQMKKNRPATMLSVLCRPEDASELASLILRETPTLGVRYHAESRFKAVREVRLVETPWGKARVKLKLLDGEIVSASPEYDDCANLAREAGVPLAEVMAAARAASGYDES